jgi:hypothetical protein
MRLMIATLALVLLIVVDQAWYRGKYTCHYADHISILIARQACRVQDRDGQQRLRSVTWRRRRSNSHAGPHTRGPHPKPHSPQRLRRAVTMRRQRRVFSTRVKHLIGRIDQPWIGFTDGSKYDSPSIRHSLVRLPEAPN